MSSSRCLAGGGRYRVPTTGRPGGAGSTPRRRRGGRTAATRFATPSRQGPHWCPRPRGGEGLPGARPGGERHGSGRPRGGRPAGSRGRPASACPFLTAPPAADSTKSIQTFQEVARHASPCLIASRKAANSLMSGATLPQALQNFRRHTVEARVSLQGGAQFGRCELHAVPGSEPVPDLEKGGAVDHALGGCEVAHFKSSPPLLRATITRTGLPGLSPCVAGGRSVTACSNSSSGFHRAGLIVPQGLPHGAAPAVVGLGGRAAAGRRLAPIPYPGGSRPEG
jgi:hypothetical protein